MGIMRRSEFCWKADIPSIVVLENVKMFNLREESQDSVGKMGILSGEKCDYWVGKSWNSVEKWEFWGQRSEFCEKTNIPSVFVLENVREKKNLWKN